jgi:hypothetical protein
MRPPILIAAGAATLTVAAGALVLPDLPQPKPRDIARAQIDLALTAEQRKLWREIAASDELPRQLAEIAVSGRVVRQQRPVRAAPVEGPASHPTEFPAAVTSGIRVLTGLGSGVHVAGRFRVASVRDQQLAVEFDEGSRLTLLAKLRGRPVRAAEGDVGRLVYHTTDPLDPADVLALEVGGDFLFRSVVGSDDPVRLRVPEFGIEAAQTGPRDGGTMAVRVSVRGESRTLRPGERVVFSGSNTTVALRASHAILGPGRYVYEGRPYRLHLVAWSTD